MPWANYIVGSSNRLILSRVSEGLPYRRSPSRPLGKVLGRTWRVTISCEGLLSLFLGQQFQKHLPLCWIGRFSKLLSKELEVLLVDEIFHGASPHRKNNGRVVPKGDHIQMKFGLLAALAFAANQEAETIVFDLVNPHKAGRGVTGLGRPARFHKGVVRNLTQQHTGEIIEKSCVGSPAGPGTLLRFVHCSLQTASREQI